MATPAAPTAMGGEKAKISLRPVCDQSDPPWLLAFFAVSPTAMAAASTLR